MRFGKRLIPLIIATLALQGLQAGSIPVAVEDNFKLAMNYVNGTAAVDTIILTTSGGVYTTTDTAYFPVLLPLTIIAESGLAEKPIFTHSDADSNVLEIFRIFNDFAVDGVIFDGGHAQSHGMKYALRFGHEDELAPNNVVQLAKVGSHIKITNCDFRDFYVDKDPALDGHAIAFLRPQSDNQPETATIKAGDVLFEDCTFENFGYEAIRISETEKYPVDSPLESLTVRNCTFTNIDAECVRYYSDLDSATADAPVLIEHLTINNSATRVMFLKNSGGAIVRDIIISNSRTSGHGRDDDLLDAQGNTGKPSFVSHIDTFNVNPQPIESADGNVDTTTIYGFDPLYEAPLAYNYTLQAGSHAYWSAHDGSTLGDLRWATNTPTTFPFTVTVLGEGSVTLDPPIEGRCYDPSTVVTLTAVPDAEQQFEGWSGDLTGTNLTETVTVNSATSITATFSGATTAIGRNGDVPQAYRLDQNYPNPFNPSTRIAFDLARSGWTTLEVYNLLGQRVATLVDKHRAAGSYSITFDGSRLSSGIYFYQLRSGNFVAIKKLVLLK